MSAYDQSRFQKYSIPTLSTFEQPTYHVDQTPTTSTYDHSRLNFAGEESNNKTEQSSWQNKVPQPEPKQAEPRPKTYWSRDNRQPFVSEFTGEPGIKVEIPDSALGFTQLFLNREFLEYLVLETNRHANQERDENHHLYKDWYPVNLKEMANYLRLVMLFGIMKLPRLNMYFSINAPYHCPAVTRCMTFNRFKSISAFFNVNDDSAIPEDNTDKLIRVRPLVDYFTKKFKDVYTPNKNMSIDERMMTYKGLLNFKRYLPDQPDKTGIKLYILAESKSGYVYNFDLHSGHGKTTLETVHTLTEPIRNKGYHVYMDNYYNSVKVSEELLKHKIYSCGMLRVIRGAPNDLQEEFKFIKDDQTLFRSKGNIFVIGWKEKSLISVISTFHNADTKKVRGKKMGRNANLGTTYVNKPIAICDYNDNMKGVDHFEQMVKFYYFARKTVKWTKKMSFYLIQLAIFNSFSLYKQYHSGPKKPMDLLAFHEMLCKELLNFQEEKWGFTGCNDLFLYNEENLLPSLYVNCDFSSTVSDTSEVPSKRPRRYDPEIRFDRNYRHDLIKTPGKKFLRCRQCFKMSKRKTTMHQCETCKIPLCVGRCHTDYHSRKPQALK